MKHLPLSHASTARVLRWALDRSRTAYIGEIVLTSHKLAPGGLNYHNEKSKKLPDCHGFDACAATPSAFGISENVHFAGTLALLANNFFYLVREDASIGIFFSPSCMFACVAQP